MINLLAICLVVSSLVSAGFWSPTPEKHSNNQEDVIVKEGRRVVVVEYDQQGQQHDTKVSISPEHVDHHHHIQEKIEEASSVLPNLGQGIPPGELICDAYGKCTRRIASAIGKAKDNAKEKAQDVLSKATETTTHKARDVKEEAKEAMANAKQTAAEKAEDVKEGAKETLSKAKSAAKETKDLGKTIGKDVAHNVTKQVGKGRDSVVETAKEAKEESEHAAKRVQSNLHKVLDKIGEVFAGLMGAMDGLMSVMNLLGFATAYGMCVWVTFISSYVLAGALPRQQFGMVQSKIYPIYFRAMAGSIGLALLGHTPRLFGSKAEMFVGANLLGSVLMVLANSMYLEPRATKLMFERMKVEKEEGRGRVAAETATAAKTTDPAAEATTTGTRRSELTRLSERLKKLNTYSSILNILTLMSLSWDLVYLGQRLHMGC